MTEQDIPSELSESDAHQRYATAVAAFITVQQSESFSEEAVELAMKTMGQLQYYTSAFLTPFADASLMEVKSQIKFTSKVADRVCQR